ncbi:hypothetical protein [Alloalcanivorax mobilis]|uniref:hypothetical protein n=1 Tax=Alloalcanivorax mobilis TaxID=2019569 RepID=UPI0018E4B707|nr:hypothetical protein [Alloalcanivorax mobilis]
MWPLALIGVGAGLWWVWQRQAGQGGGTTPAPGASSSTGTDTVLGGIIDELLNTVANNGAGASTDGPMNMDPNLPRGIRNNNPGNIRRSADAWQGLSDTQTDTAFFQFRAPLYGIRALAKILRNYRDLYGLYTVRGIINRWAPPVENNTGAYVNAVAGAMGVSADVPLQWDLGELRALVGAIIKHENGQQPYTASLLDQAIQAAGW